MGRKSWPNFEVSHLDFLRRAAWCDFQLLKSALVVCEEESITSELRLKMSRARDAICLERSHWDELGFSRLIKNVYATKTEYKMYTESFLDILASNMYNNVISIGGNRITPRIIYLISEALLCYAKFFIPMQLVTY